MKMAYTLLANVYCVRVNNLSEIHDLTNSLYFKTNRVRNNKHHGSQRYYYYNIVTRRHGGKNLKILKQRRAALTVIICYVLIIVVKNAVIVLARLRALWFNVCLVTTGLKQTSYSSLEIIGSHVISYSTADNII